MAQPPSFDLLGIAVIFATLASPLIALWATVVYQRRDRSYQLRLSVFVDLMRYRRKNLSQEYVNSLNLVPVVFHDKPSVVASFKELMEVYESNDWNTPQESPTHWDVYQRLNQTLQNRTAVLLSKMAEDVRINVDQLTILQGAYLPRQWTQQENLENEIRQSLRSILNNERPLTVFAHVVPARPADTGAQEVDVGDQPTFPENSPATAT